MRGACLCWALATAVAAAAMLGAASQMEAGEGPTKATLSGVVTGASPGDVTLIVARNLHEISLDDDGVFAFSIDVTGPAYAELRLAPGGSHNVPLFLVPGESFSLTADANDLERTLEFSGGRAAENRLLGDLHAKYDQTDFGALYATEPARFLELLAAQERRWRTELESLVEQHPGLDDSFVAHERLRIDYLTATLRVDRLGTSHGWASFAEDLDIENPERLGFDAYDQFLWYYVKALAEERVGKDPSLRTSVNRDTEARYAAAREVFKTPSVRNAVLGEVLNNQLSGDRDGWSYGCKGIETLIARFDADCTDASLRDAVARKYRECLAGRNAPLIRMYKVIGPIALDAHIFPAKGVPADDKRPAVLFFHGGGWAGGIPEWGYGGCRRYAEMGVVGISFEYRLRGRHGTTPVDAVADAQSALQWTVAHAPELGIDPARIVVSGFSAGGHMAAALGTLPKRVDDGTPMTVTPAAMVLPSSCVDVADHPWVRQCLAGKADASTISPAAFIRPGLPPTIMIHGTRDQTCDYGLARAFCDALAAAGNDCELVTIQGGHFRSPDEWATIDAKTDAFLRTRGIIH